MQCVEIKGYFGQYLLGSIDELENDKCFIIYHGSNKVDILPLSSVRFATESEPPLDVHVGSEIEALLETQDKESLHWEFDDVKTGPHSVSNSVDSLTQNGWWRCTVKAKNPDTFAVSVKSVIPEDASESLQNLHKALTDNVQLVSKSKIRAITNTTFGIDLSAMCKFSVPLPNDLQRFGNVSILHKKILRRLNGPALLTLEKVTHEVEEEKEGDESNPDATTVRRSTSSLVFYSPDEKIIERIKLLLDDHWMNVRKKAAILRQKQTAMPYSIHSRPANKMDFYTVPDHLKDFPVIDRFQLPSSLIRFCIGPQGSNIKKARAIPDIGDVHVSDPSQYDYLENNDPCGQIVIYAKTNEAIQKAKDLLEFCRLRFAFPQSFIGRLIGKQTNNIHSVIDKSGVVHINLCNPDDCPTENLVNTRTVYIHTEDGEVQSRLEPVPNESYASFIIVGDKESVIRAELLLTAQIDNISEVNKLEIEKAQLFSQRPFLGNTGPKTNWQQGSHEPTAQQRIGGQRPQKKVDFNDVDKRQPLSNGQGDDVTTGMRRMNMNDRQHNMNDRQHNMNDRQTNMNDRQTNSRNINRNYGDGYMRGKPRYANRRGNDRDYERNGPSQEI